MKSTFESHFHSYFFFVLLKVVPWYSHWVNASKRDSLWTLSTSLLRSQPSFVRLPYAELNERRALAAPADALCGIQPPSGLSRIWASPARHLWHYFFHFLPQSRPWGVAWLLGLCGIHPRPNSRKGSGSTTTTKFIYPKPVDDFGSKPRTHELLLRI